MRIVIEYALSFLPFEVKQFEIVFEKNTARTFEFHILCYFLS